MRRFACLAAILLPLLTAGCGGGLDRLQVDLCRRVLPALHPDGSSLREIRVALGPGRNGVRIDYAAREPGAEQHMHFAVCGFAAGDRLELTGVQTEEQTLGEARLLYLKR